MTISIEIPNNSYIADGIIVTYAYTFTILENNHIKVSVDNVDQVEGVDYALANQIDGGGDVVFLAGSIPTNGAIVNLRRQTDKDQQTEYNPHDPFPAKTHELALDKLTMISQESLGGGGGGNGFDPTADFNTSGNWINSGVWQFNGTLLYNGVQVAVTTDLPDVSGFTSRNINEVIGGDWSFNNGITLNQSVWPADRGNADQVLKTDGLGTLAWIDQSGGAGFDPTANYSTTGDWSNAGAWDFTQLVILNGGAHLANSQNISARNVANTQTFDVAKTEGDEIVFGDVDAETEIRYATILNFTSTLGNEIVFVDNLLGSILLKDRLGVTKKAGIRNPGTQVINDGDSFNQNQEGQVADYTGPAGGNLTIDTLELYTTITLNQGSTGSVNLLVGTANINWRDGSGLAKTGARVVAANSVVQLRWRTAIECDIWGNGIS